MRESIPYQEIPGDVVLPEENIYGFCLGKAVDDKKKNTAAAENGLELLESVRKLVDSVRVKVSDASTANGDKDKEKEQKKKEQEKKNSLKDTFVTINETIYDSNTKCKSIVLV